ncbi:MAG: ABC transporter ATP-binding protein, partial [Candidatus Bathyarchaeia archaeon]
MIRIIKELSKKHVTIFLSSHLLPVVEKLCNKVGIIRDGRIIVVDAVDNLTNRLRSVEIHGLV